jgi:hypothetical protein
MACTVLTICDAFTLLSILFPGPHDVYVNERGSLLEDANPVSTAIRLFHDQAFSHFRPIVLCELYSVVFRYAFGWVERFERHNGHVGGRQKWIRPQSILFSGRQ